MHYFYCPTVSFIKAPVMKYVKTNPPETQMNAQMFAPAGALGMPVTQRIPIPRIASVA